MLLANAMAIRIDEGTMTVYGLSKGGDEAKIRLNPNCRADQYIRRVRELLSSNVLGSPGGYPIYLKRWTRMGQTSGARLSDLLMLGEPEAVVAVSGAPGLTDELARCAWWTMPDSDNARRMLRRECVVKGKMGRVLAEFLIEFLPFEQEPQAIIETVRLILQPGLISDEARAEVWERGRSKSVFRIGFLQACPDTLPVDTAERDDLHTYRSSLEQCAEAGNRFARQLLRTLSASGQAFVQTGEAALRRPSNQDSVCALLDAIGDYFASARLSLFHFDSMDSIESEVINGCENRCHEDADSLHELLKLMPQLQAEIKAMLMLALVGEPAVRPIFARTDAIGSVMRRKLEPVIKPLAQQLSVLLGNGA